MSARSRSTPTVLITGAAGFRGSHLCDYFLGRDWPARDWQVSA